MPEAEVVPFEPDYPIEPFSTLEKVRGLLVKAVIEKGVHYQYPQSEMFGGTCTYVYDGKPSCIWGYAISYEYPLEDTPWLEWSGCAIETVATQLGLVEPSDLSLIRAMGAAQNANDDYYEWGDALVEFDNVIKEHLIRETRKEME